MNTKTDDLKSHNDLDDVPPAIPAEQLNPDANQVELRLIDDWIQMTHEFPAKFPRDARVKLAKLRDQYLHEGFSDEIINQLRSVVEAVAMDGSKRTSSLGQVLELSDLNRVAGLADLSDSHLAVILGITAEDYFEAKFNQANIERLVAVEATLEYGLQVFERKDTFKEWLFAQRPSLGNIAPIQVLSEKDGFMKINDELSRIEEGMFS